MATHSRHRSGRALVPVLLAFLAAGCLSGNPPPSSPAPASSSAPGASDARAGTLRLAIPSDPTVLSPAATDAPTQLVDRFLYAALYRLDARQVAQPELAASAPAVSADGRTWTVRLRAGLRFSDGSSLTSADVVRTYQLALSAACPFGTVCAPIAAAVTGVTAPDPLTVVFSLRSPAAPLLAEGLAQLGIVSAAAVDASLARLLAGAASLDATAVSDLVEGIAGTVNGEACLAASPPPECDLANDVPQLETVLRQAGLPLPDQSLALGSDGQPSRTAYGQALFDAVSALASTLQAHGLDQQASAFPLLDLGRQPVASGPFRLLDYVPGQRLDLERWGPSPGRGAPQRVQVAIVADPAVAATMLQTGSLDWLPEVAPDLVATLAADPALHVAARPSDTLQAIVFNVRPGHVYSDLGTRAAFAMCLDRAAAWKAAGLPAALLADGLLPPGSWAAAPGGWPAPDPVAARRMLAAAGWSAGPDGILVRGAERLASAIYVRSGRADLLAFADAAAAQLRTCGIELEVRPLGYSGDVLLPQLEYPNTFDTFLAGLTAGPDPDADLQAYETSHLTTQANPGDADFGGWSDATTDRLLAAAAASSDVARRADLYRQVQARLAAGVAVLPIAWDPAYAAVSGRLEIAGHPVDPARAGYAADLPDWRLATP